MKTFQPMSYRPKTWVGQMSVGQMVFEQKSWSQFLISLRETVAEGSLTCSCIVDSFIQELQSLSFFGQTMKMIKGKLEVKSVRITVYLKKKLRSKL
jgi:hypothetical protein